MLSKSHGGPGKFKYTASSGAVFVGDLRNLQEEKKTLSELLQKYSSDKYKEYVREMERRRELTDNILARIEDKIERADDILKQVKEKDKRYIEKMQKQIKLGTRRRTQMMMGLNSENSEDEDAMGDKKNEEASPARAPGNARGNRSQEVLRGNNRAPSLFDEQNAVAEQTK